MDHSAVAIGRRAGFGQRGARARGTVLWRHDLGAGLLLALPMGLPGAALAQEACPPEPGRMCLLGTLNLGDRVWNQAFGVSADGTFVVGQESDRALVRVFRWDAANGMAALGTLRTDNNGNASVTGVSADGAVVVGQSETDAGGSRAFRWDAATGEMTDLGSLRADRLGFSTPLDVSADGRVVVGQADTDDGIDAQRAFRWDAASGAMIDLGTLATDNSGESVAFVTRADGAVVVGDAESDDARWRAFRWDAATGMVDLGTLRADSSGDSRARDASADGSVVVGRAETDGGSEHAFRWDAATGEMTDLGTLRADNSGFSVAFDVSADGSVVSGSAATDDGASRAFRWDAASGAMTDLGTLRADKLGNSRAADLSADGSVVVGTADTDDIYYDRAFRWDAATGDMLDLGTLRADNGGLSRATGVSADGTVVVGLAEAGYGTVRHRAFIWRADTMLDHANTAAAVQASAQSIAATAALYGQTTVQQLGREVALRGPGAGNGDTAAPRPVAVRVGGLLAHNADVASGAGADVSAAIGLTPKLTLGGFVEIVGETDSDSAVSLGGTYVSGGASLRYRASPDGTGLTWRVAAVAGGGDFDVTRRDFLPNTETGKGATALTALGLSAEIGYGIATAGGMVTPFARLTGSRVTRDGFTETDASAFPLAYDDHRDEALTLTLGGDARFDLSDRGTLSLGGGLSHDLSRSDDPVTGTSAIPGLTRFAVEAPELENRTRAFAYAGYGYSLGGGRALSGSLAFAQSPWTDAVSVYARFGYEIRF
jgi:probable HAF family extracellular repeat protein